MASNGNGKYRATESATRGQKIRVETGRDRSDDGDQTSEILNADLAGSKDDLSHSIKNGKVPTDA